MEAFLGHARESNNSSSSECAHDWMETHKQTTKKRTNHPPKLGAHSSLSGQQHADDEASQAPTCPTCPTLLTHVVAAVPCLPTIPAHSAVSLSTFLVARSSSLTSVPQPSLPSSTTHIFATLAHIVHQLVSAGVHSFFTHWFHCGGCGYVISFLLPFVEVCRRGNSGRNRVISWPFSVGTIKTSSTMMLSSANRHQQCDSFVPRTVLISKPSGINFLTARVVFLVSHFSKPAFECVRLTGEVFEDVVEVFHIFGAIRLANGADQCLNTPMLCLTCSSERIIRGIRCQASDPRQSCTC